jgi:hypothetical protein
MKLLLVTFGYWWLFHLMLLLAILGYITIGYLWLFYWWLFVTIYWWLFIGDYWCLLVPIILMDIDSYSIGGDSILNYFL